MSPSYGSLGTGINLTFIEEVQVKTGAFEPKYGKADGGLVQIVTKSGGTQYHGALAAYFAPRLFCKPRNPNLPHEPRYSHVNSAAMALHPAFDASAEFGGYIPVFHQKDKLFFYGAYNPALNRTWSFRPRFSAALYSHGAFTNNTTE